MPSTADTLAQNEALVRRFYDEIHHRGNQAAAEELVAPDFVDHVFLPYPGQPTGGPAAVTWLISRFRAAFPDLQVTIEDLLAAEDRVAVRVTWSGTHSGEFLGITPSGKQMRVAGFDFIRLARGKVVEHWGQVDILALMSQLGFLPQADEGFL